MITPRIFFGSFSRAFRYLIFASSSLCSSSSSVRASFVSRRSGMSKMWFAWISESLNFDISLVRACSASWERPDHLDDLVEVIERDQEALDDVVALLGLPQVEACVRRVTTSIW